MLAISMYILWFQFWWQILKMKSMMCFLFLFYHFHNSNQKEPNLIKMNFVSFEWVDERTFKERYTWIHGYVQYQSIHFRGYFHSQINLTQKKDTMASSFVTDGFFGKVFSTWCDYISPNRVSFVKRKKSCNEIVS